MEVVGAGAGGILETTAPLASRTGAGTVDLATVAVALFRTNGGLLADAIIDSSVCAGWLALLVQQTE